MVGSSPELYSVARVEQKGTKTWVSGLTKCVNDFAPIPNGTHSVGAIELTVVLLCSESNKSQFYPCQVWTNCRAI